jgi:hypothetical protein
VAGGVAKHVPGRGHAGAKVARAIKIKRRIRIRGKRLSPPPYGVGTRA